MAPCGGLLGWRSTDGQAVPQDGVDLVASSGAFHELAARLMLEHERVLALNGELCAELARLRTSIAVQPLGEFNKLAVLEGETAESKAALEQNVVEVEAIVELQDEEEEEVEEEEEGEQEEEECSPEGANMHETPVASDTDKKQRDFCTMSAGSSVSDVVTRLSSNGRHLTGTMMDVYCFMEDSDSSVLARRYKAFMQMLLLVAVCTPLLQMPEQATIIPWDVGAVIETTFDVVFTIELLVRLIVSPAPRIFFCQTYNIIDLASPATLTFRAIMLGSGVSVGEDINTPSIILHCLTPISRLLKMLRRWETMHLLTKAFADVLEALPILLFPFIVLTLTFAALVYVAEPRDNIPSLPRALWLTLVTMSTVGYGDVFPVSTYGLLIVSLLVIMSVMYMALPVAILGSSFTQVWQEREAVMLMHLTRKRLEQWGYTANDIPGLFRAFHKDKHFSVSELTVVEFVRMIKALKFNLPDERILELFRVFDTNRNGCLEEKEFMRVLFPKRFVEVYSLVDDEAVDGPESSEQGSPRGF